MTAPTGARLSLAVKITLLATATELAILTGVLLIAPPMGWRAMVAIGGLMLIPAVVTYLLTRFLVGRLTFPVIDAYQRLAAGDFTAELPTATAGKDFLGLRVGFRVMAEALERSLAEIRATDRERRRLFADLAHELATPTTTLMGIAAALESGGGDRARLLELLEHETQRLERLIGDIRELAALEDPDLALSFEDADVTALALAAVERARLASPAAGQIACVGVAAIATVDPVRIDQVLANLIGNASRHAGAAAVEVAIEAERDHVVIAVDDGGPGVPDAQLPQLGRRLLRVDPSRARDTGGHGLGLSIVRAIVARHDGTLTFARSALGGLAVRVTLPRRRP